MPQVYDTFWMGSLASLLAGLGTGVGALGIFLLKRPSARTEDGMLSAAAGIMLAATFFSLLLPALGQADELTLHRPLGVAFVGEPLARIFAMPGVAYRPFAAPPPMSKLGVAWRQDATSNTVRWFLEVLDELAATNGNGHHRPARAPALVAGPGRSPGLSWPDGEPG